MKYHPNNELADIATAIQETTDCTSFDAQKAAEDVQEVVDKHRGGSDLVKALEALTAERDRLMAAVEAWYNAEPEAEHRAERNMLLEAGIIVLTPDDE